MTSQVPRELGAHPVAVLGSISAGGVAGALARHGLSEVFPRDPGGWPWATWAVNVAGCLLLGVLMVLISEVWTGRRLLRPFLGVGVLGGFTTFSTAMVEVQQLVAEGAARPRAVVSSGHGGGGDGCGDHRFRGDPVGAVCGRAAGETIIVSGLVSVMGVAVGAAVGAPARYLLDRAVQSRHDSVAAVHTS